MENLTDFEAGRLTGIYHTLAILELVAEEMAPDSDSPTAIAIQSILNELVEKTREKALS